jgi:hypothetical protein
MWSTPTVALNEFAATCLKTPPAGMPAGLGKGGEIDADWVVEELRIVLDPAGAKFVDDDCDDVPLPAPAEVGDDVPLLTPAEEITFPLVALQTSGSAVTELPDPTWLLELGAVDDPEVLPLFCASLESAAAGACCCDAGTTADSFCVLLSTLPADAPPFDAFTSWIGGDTEPGVGETLPINAGEVRLGVLVTTELSSPVAPESRKRSSRSSSRTTTCAQDLFRTAPT